MNAVFKLIDKAGYKSNHKKELQDCLEKTEKYMAMSSNEFLVAYIDAKVKYEQKKTLLSGISLALVLSILMGQAIILVKDLYKPHFLLDFSA